MAESRAMRRYSNPPVIKTKQAMPTAAEAAAAAPVVKTEGSAPGVPVPAESAAFFDDDNAFAIAGTYIERRRNDLVVIISWSGVEPEHRKECETCPDHRRC